MRLASPGTALTAHQIDWAGLDRRRRGELAKLDAVQRYAYTTGCRRAFVLRYFGDAAAGAACSGCDNCMGIRHEAPRAAGAPTRPRRKASRRRDDDRFERRVVGPAADLGAPVVGAADGPLFEALRTLRGELARAQQVPAYVVFADRTLAEMAVHRPRSLQGLGDIRGVGPAKLEKYGERFLAVIRAATDTEAA